MLNDNPILSAAIRHVRLPNDMSFVIAYSGSLVHCFSGGGRGLVRKIHACIRQGAQVFEINYVAGAAEPALSRLEYDIYFWMEKRPQALLILNSSTDEQLLVDKSHPAEALLLLEVQNAPEGVGVKIQQSLSLLYWKGEACGFITGKPWQLSIISDALFQAFEGRGMP